jgi:uncharacterized membrane protein
MNPKRLWLRVCALALLLALPAAARQIVIKNFDEQVVVHRDSTIEVSERIEAQFVGANWHGIYRTIPVEYRDSAGLNYTLFLDDVRATDDEGNPLKLEQSRVGNEVKFKIYVPEADNSTRTILLHYRVLDGLRFFADHDEFYWNVTGEEWDSPIQSASARIELPDGASGVRAIAYTGVFNARGQDANVTVRDNVVNISTTRPLGYHQGLTVVVGFDKGLVHEPTAAEKIALFLRSNWPLAIPIAVLGVMFWLWWTRGRDPERDAVSVQYEPPDKLTPAECGALVEGEAAMRDITSTLVDLAVKGYITIEQKDQSGLLGLTHHRDYVFRLNKPPAQWTDARAHERAMLGGLFYDGDPGLSRASVPGAPAPVRGIQDSSLEAGAVLRGSAPASVAAPPPVDDDSAAFRGTSGFGETPQPSVALSQLQNQFYKQLPSIRGCILDALVQDGYYLHRPDTVRQGYIGVALLVAFLVFATGNWSARHYGMSTLTWILAAAFSGVIVGFVGWFMPARTITGARTFAKVLGFEEFLSRVESDRIKRLENAPQLFEKFLPYAMALHVEKKWVQAFAGIAMPPPAWYQGAVYGAAFQPYFLVNDLNMMSSQAGTVMASAPRSSGASGFGGGGGAGGGFGGGGGGGF